MNVTILKQLGITDDILDLFIYKGLVVPEKFQKRKIYLKSPSSEWFSEIADAYAPPLSQEENNEFRNSIRKLSWKIISGAKSVVELSFFLKRAYERVKTLSSNTERVAALYTILHLFHSCLDYCYLKYDRHLEYHEYYESPVGYWFIQLKNIASRLGISSEILLDGSRRLLESTEGLLESGISINRLYKLHIKKEKLVCSLLDKLEDEAGLFLRILDSIEEIFDVQEIEGKIMSVKYEFLGGTIFDFLVEVFCSLKKEITRSEDIISTKYKSYLLELNKINCNIPIEVFSGARKILEIGHSLFNDTISKLIVEELGRWRKL